MSAARPVEDETVTLLSPMPHRYIFIPSSSRPSCARLLATCRARTRAAGRPVYRVVDGQGEFVGLRAPHYVLEGILQEEMRLREDVRALFPGIPEEQVEGFLAWVEDDGGRRGTGNARELGREGIVRGVLEFVGLERCGRAAGNRGRNYYKKGGRRRRTRCGNGVEKIVRGWGFAGMKRQRQRKRKYHCRRGRGGRLLREVPVAESWALSLAAGESVDGLQPFSSETQPQYHPDLIRETITKDENGLEHAVLSTLFNWVPPSPSSSSSSSSSEDRNSKGYNPYLCYMAPPALSTTQEKKRESHDFQSDGDYAPSSSSSLDSMARLSLNETLK
ncbi:hypothetical protein GGR50DRAFT_699966 [Xylaria sp. CBS 124048]|nr:hypothetical protein GGR50DRAFT_699966 [Xylaria sp. CBS 124048]